ncbi:tail fiber assembly protein [Morganella morganii subsp. morganii]|uniref:tail fiber assembly protein n=1 Tax=Morganella morganii TaxID=582 RepID=UPI001BD47D67|nr:tail fiber assembly protein [Morganella morganii]MBS9543651.1 tail fiber assembly protein [Morganella morganii subsp. morganii]
MKNYIYSASQNMILPVSLKQIYVDAGTWPEDGTAISDEVAGEFMGQYPQGKTLSHDKDGQPCWADIPPLPKEQQIAEAEEKKAFLISEVESETAMLRAKLALGRIKDDEKALLNAWLDYLGELEAVDVSTAPDIIWPLRPVV